MCPGPSWSVGTSTPSNTTSFTSIDGIRNSAKAVPGSGGSSVNNSAGDDHLVGARVGIGLPGRSGHGYGLRLGKPDRELARALLLASLGGKVGVPVLVGQEAEHNQPGRHQPPAGEADRFLIGRCKLSAYGR